MKHACVLAECVTFVSFRKQRNPNYELSVKAKKIWEKLRIQKGELSKKEKSELVETLMATVKEQNKKVK